MKKIFLVLSICSFSLHTINAFDIEFQEVTEQKEYIPKIGGQKFARQSGDFDHNIIQASETNALLHYPALVYTGFTSPTDTSTRLYARRIEGLPLALYDAAPDLAYQAYLIENGKVMGIVTGKEAKNILDSLSTSYRIKQRSH